MKDDRESLASRIPLVLWSGAAWAASFLSMGAGLGVGLALQPFLPWPRNHFLLPAQAFGFCVSLTGSRFRLVIDPNFDTERPSVFCQNHVSVMDGLIAARAIPHPFCGLMEAWHFRIPIYGWALNIAGGIGVPEGSGRYSSIVAQGKDRIARGISILTFPEAHRTLDGNVREFRHGPFFMARDIGAPMVPIVTHGVYKVNHKGTWLLRPGRTIKVYIGPQIETSKLTEEQVPTLAACLQGAMASFVADGDVDRVAHLCHEMRNEFTTGSSVRVANPKLEAR
jgi:1-acyl-sn-glycerol-3-phosphate acyltransferase